MFLPHSKSAKKQNHKRKSRTPKSDPKMPRRDGGGAKLDVSGPLIILIVVVAAIGLAVYPVYPRVTATFRISGYPTYPHQISFLSTKLDYLTVVVSAGIQRNTIFVYTVSPDTGSSALGVALVAQVSYDGEVLATTPIYTIASGVYSLSFLDNYRAQQSGSYYQIQVNATYSDGSTVSQTANAVPS